MTKTKFPSIKDVASQLREANRTTLLELDEDEGIDVRLQVYEDGGWAVHSGDAQYDTDHRGFWGASSVPGNKQRFNAVEIARDLIDQARDDHAQAK